MSACTYPYIGVADAFVVEARACKRALCFAFDMGSRKIILEGDSVTIIKRHFVRREVNRVAHALAMDGPQRHTSCFWVEEAPDSVEKLVE